ncbi:MAG: hypothetical protein ACYDIA_23545 [Candidatus Humimicrobiaceae bacterium]
MDFEYKKNMDEVVGRKKLWTKNFASKILAKIDVGSLNTVDIHMDMMKNSHDYKKIFNY